jgi:hypothetical protein
LTIKITLAQAQEQLEAGNARTAQNMFFEIWENLHGASLDERQQALRGYCAALDAQGRWHFSETESEAGLTLLQREEDKIRQEEQRRKQTDADISVLMWGAPIVLGGLIIGSLLAPPRRARRAA